MEISLLKEKLGNSPVSQLRAYDEIGSTNDEALRWLDEGAPDFALVIADSQTKGRGRLNRKWITRPGSSLAFSVILKPAPGEMISPNALYAPLCGLAIWQVLRQQYDLQPKIKWPNDILINQQKCCGILVEAAWLGQTLTGVVMGIGINITQNSLPPDADFHFPATWLEKYTNQPIDRFFLLSKVLIALQDWRKKLGNPEFFRTWNDALAFRGEEVQVEQINRLPVIGCVEGINKQGNLLIKPKTGAIITIEAGDVHLRPAAEKRKEPRRF